MLPRLVAVLAAALCLAPSAGAVPTPRNLHAFLLKVNEPTQATRTFARNPAFAWNAVKGATRYEFELATSRRFSDNSIVYEGTSVSPLMTVPVRLPWMTGARYSWYARVRAVTNGSVSLWSDRYGFNLRAPSAPRTLSSGATNPTPGMIRWTPVAGATGYEVVFLYDLATGRKKKIKTATTAADLREYYTFHNTRAWTGTIHWRVRALRELAGNTDRPLNGLPSVSYGPWSRRNTTSEPALATTPIQLAGSISRSRGYDVRSTTATGGPGPGAHELVPGFWWSGRYSPAPERLGGCDSIESAYGITCPLFHVYVYTDADCVNRVHASDLVGSPAYVPRLSGPLGLPAGADQLRLAAGVWLGDAPSEGKVFDAGGDKVVAAGLAGSSGGGSGEDTDRKTGLWDVDWATSRYYWTVVPVVPYITQDNQVEYHDVAFAEDTCAVGKVLPFAKTSAVATASAAGVPYVSGMSARTGRLTSARTRRPRFFGRILVAWKPAAGAQGYEVQWSRSRYPFVRAGRKTTAATAAPLDLAAGRRPWFYRVRGLDPTLPGTRIGMTWSEPVRVVVVPRTFRIVSAR